jgi:hypothetical protein
MKRPRIESQKLSAKEVRYLRKNIRYQDFCGHRYKVVWKKPTKELAGGDAWGLCDDPTSPEKTIHISPHLEEYDFLTTCLDEAIHGCNFSLDNDHVAEIADSIGLFLWKIGFRLERDKNGRTTKDQ